MIRDIEIECLEESIYNEIADGYDSNQNVKLSTPLYYAISGPKDTLVTVSDDINKLRKNCISNALRVWMPPNTIVSSSNSELVVEGGKWHLNLYNAVKDPSVDEMVQHIKNIVFNAEEMRKNYAAGSRANKPCYHFGNLVDIGCTVKDALQHLNKVIDSWTYWRIAEDYNDSFSILDEAEKDVTEDLIPSETQRIVEAIHDVANNDVYSILIYNCDVHYY